MSNEKHVIIRGQCMNRNRIGGCDNGGSFQTKISEDKIEKLLKDTELLMRNASNTQTAYTLEIPRLDQPCYTSTG